MHMQCIADVVSESIDASVICTIFEDEVKWAWYVEQLTPEEALAWADGDEASELDWGLALECPHEFVPLGFEAGGAFGPATRDFVREVARVVGTQASTDLYHWSAMVWGEHW